MQTILNFIIKHNHWFLFVLFEGISFMLIVQFNNYQVATFFTSANSMAGNIFGATKNMVEYFSLGTRNQELLAHNSELMNEVVQLRSQIAELQNEAAMRGDTIVRSYSSQFKFNTANIVNNSLNKLNNFIVIDKGKSDGVEAEMGVFSSKGVVGIIYLTSEQYSLVLPLLNSKSNISCRIQGNSEFSTLQWDGKDTRYSYLVDLPKYTHFERGDTVVTSGFSSIFPAGIPVGSIESLEESLDGMFYRAKVELFVDFGELSSVFVVGNKGHNEQQILESNIPKE